MASSCLLTRTAIPRSVFGDRRRLGVRGSEKGRHAGHHLGADRCRDRRRQVAGPTLGVGRGSVHLALALHDRLRSRYGDPGRVWPRAQTRSGGACTATIARRFESGGRTERVPSR